MPPGPFEISFEAIPLPAFINEVFGRLLDLSYQMGPEVQSADDLVTLRLSGPRDGEELYSAALNVLASFGVQVRREAEMLYLKADAQASAGRVPLLASGRALPSMPDSRRTIFQFVPLEVLRNAQVRSWLTRMFPGRRIAGQRRPRSQRHYPAGAAGAGSAGHRGHRSARPTLHAQPQRIAGRSGLEQRLGAV